MDDLAIVRLVLIIAGTLITALIIYLARENNKLIAKHRYQRQKNLHLQKLLKETMPIMSQHYMRTKFFTQANILLEEEDK